MQIGRFFILNCFRDKDDDVHLMIFLLKATFDVYKIRNIRKMKSCNHYFKSKFISKIFIKKKFLRKKSRNSLTV